MQVPFGVQVGVPPLGVPAQELAPALQRVLCLERMGGLAGVVCLESLGDHSGLDRPEAEGHLALLEGTP